VGHGEQVVAVLARRRPGRRAAGEQLGVGVEQLVLRLADAAASSAPLSAGRRRARAPVAATARCGRRSRRSGEVLSLR
jgi:hypothetical protein